MGAEFLNQFERLDEYLSGHLLITVVPLFFGLLIGIPLSTFICRFKKLQWPTLTFVSIIQTIPGLALLALMVPILVFAGSFFSTNLPAFGFLPAAIALTLYSLLPIIRNTVTGLSSVDPALIEAAKGLGMRPWQILMKIQYPIAAPVIIAGIRTAAVWVVGTATLATPVGQTSLGNYIFSGLQTRTWIAVIFGCVSAAVLAILIDSLLALVEKAWSKRKTSLAIVGFIGLALLFSVGVGPHLVKTFQTQSPKILIGSKTFTEQYILAEVIQLRLNKAGVESERVESLGSTIAFNALANNEIDVYVDYSGTIWANYMKRNDTPNPSLILEQTKNWAKQNHDVLQLGALGFENTYALAMRSDRAKELGLETISALASKASSRLSVGGDYEFFERPEWKKLQKDYSIEFKEEKSFDSTFMYEAVKQSEVDVITAFSSDGRIAAYQLKVLDDDKKSFPPYDAVILLSPNASQNPQVIESLQKLVGSISIELMREANKKVDVDGDSPKQAAQWLNTQLKTSFSK